MKSPTVINPSKEDVPSLKKLWKDVFKDTDDYIELFFSVKYKAENTFIIKEDGEIASMFFAEPNTIVAGKENLKGVYLCGLATREDKRGKGYAKILTEYATSFFDADIYFLIPANQELFSFYDGLGFKPFTYLTKVEIKKEQAEEIPGFSNEFSYETLNGFYENSDNGLFVKREFSDFKAIYDCYKNFMIFDNGYIIYYIGENILHIIEYTLPYQDACKVGSYLISQKGLLKGYILKKYGDTPFVAYKSHLDLSDIENKYINLMLN